MDSREISGAASRIKKDLGKSYARMADEIGVSPRTFGDYRRGRRTPPLWRVRRIQEVLGARSERELFWKGPAFSYLGSFRTHSYLNNIVLSRIGYRIAVTDLIGGIYSVIIRNNRLLKRHEKEIPLSWSYVYFGKTGSLLALSSFEDYAIDLWDVDMDRKAVRIKGIDSTFSISPGCSYFAGISWEKILHVYRIIPRSIPIQYNHLTVLKERARLDLSEMCESGSCGGLHFSDDESTIFFRGPHEDAVLYRWESGDDVRTLPGIRAGSNTKMQLSPDNALLLTATDMTFSFTPQEECSVRIWDVESERLVREVGGASPAAFIRRNEALFLVYYSAGGTIEVEDARSGERIGSYTLPCFRGGSPRQTSSIKISNDGRLMAICCNTIDEEFGMGIREETDVFVFALDWD